MHRSIAFWIIVIMAMGVARGDARQTVSAQEPPPSPDDINDSVVCELPELRRELLERMERDQKARFEMMAYLKPTVDKPVAPMVLPPEVIEKVQVIDDENRKWLKEQIAQRGWLTRDRVGVDGAHAAWLLVQHADAEPEFQAECLELMKKCDDGQVSQTDIAYLEDRVRTAQGKPQLYGTQLSLKDGEWEVREVEDPDRLDERRKGVGLPPMAEYLKQFRELQGEPTRQQEGPKK